MRQTTQSNPPTSRPDSDAPAGLSRTLLPLVTRTLALAALMTGCASRPVGYGCATTPAQRDVAQRDTPLPAIDPEAVYVEHTETAIVEAPPDALLEWIVSVPLEEVLTGHADIAAVARTTLLTPSWGIAGSRRRVELADGHSALEQLLAYQPGQRFEYTVWNFTNDAKRATDYAVAEFRVQPAKNGSHVTWTYRFQSRSWLTRGALKRFVRDRYASLMRSCMRRIQRLAPRGVNQAPTAVASVR